MDLGSIHGVRFIDPVGFSCNQTELFRLVVVLDTKMRNDLSA